jgi:cbb3-type cytochrome oxidase maturation protein
MKDYFYLIPIAIGVVSRRLPHFTGRLRRQYDDLEGAAERILHEETDAPRRN